MSKKSLVLAAILSLTLTATSPAIAATRAGDPGRDPSPIHRIVKLIKKLFTIVPTDSGTGVPHP